jgi:hypothetical protein
MPLPQAPMMIDASKGQIFEGKVPQTTYGSLRREATCGDFVKQFFQLSGSHAT